MKYGLLIRLKLQKLLGSLLIVMVIFSRSAAGLALAQDAPTPPSAPTAPSAPTQSETPPTAPEAPPAPSAPGSDSSNSTTNETEDSSEEVTHETAPSAPSSTTDTETIGDAGATNQEATTSDTTASAANDTSGTSSTLAAHNPPGSSTIVTGDSLSSGSLTNTGNSNASTTTQPTSSISIQNQGNGTASTGATSVSVTDNSQTTQANQAALDSDLQLQSQSGSNTNSLNVGDSYTKTGDANVSGSIINAVNTNINGVAVAEFNVVDNHQGDIILNFDQGCLIGCGTTSSLTTQNQQNGNHSQSTNSVTNQSTDATFQTNTASAENNLTLAANSGKNQANLNTGGDTVIATGDANVAAQALTFLNNNIAGNVLVGVVNIFGDLVGDIILPESLLTADPSSTSSSNSTELTSAQNGTQSHTTTTTNTASTDSFQTNDVDIENNLILTTETGNNETNLNTGGDSVVKTGNTLIDANVLNIANTNLVGGNMWLVIVNQAGNWLGKIIGAPDGATFAGSSDSQFTVEGDTITVTNNQNGAETNNTVNQSQTATTTTSQSNTAKVVNNLNLSALTGGNQANLNTGGDTYIQTGDAQIVANLINFVNNNIAGNGKLLVALVNVFGSWQGDVVPPGQEKRHQPPASSTTETTTQVGGPNQVASNSQSESQPSQPLASTTNPFTPYLAPTLAPSPVRKATSEPTRSTGSYQPFVLGNTSWQPTQPLATLASAAPLSDTQPLPKKVVRINLAWLLTLMPLGPVAMVARRFLRLA